METFIKIIGALVAVLGGGKVIYDITTSARSRFREEYKFAQEFFKDLEENPNIHPFAVEKGYQAIAGNARISSEEVSYLLSLKNPVRCLNLYVSSRKYLEIPNKEGDLQVVFRKKYSSHWSRNWRKFSYRATYVVLSLIAIAPILIPQYLIFIILTFPLGYFAVMALNSFISIKQSEELVNNQQRHTQTIVIPYNNINIPKK